jgi:hypothetical protein
MEIRSSLKKIDSYLKIVTDLNNAILEEGTMAPEELQIMKKYLFNCVDRIENIQTKLGLTFSNDEQKAINEIDEDDIKTHTNNIAEQNNAVVATEAITPNEKANNNLIEKDLRLHADLPSVQFNAEIDFNTYHKTIEDKKNQVLVEVEEMVDNAKIIQQQNTLVADEIEKVEDKIEFKTENNIIENKVSLVADEVENIEDKIEFKSENNIIENKVSLVADEVENIEDKIEFKSENNIIENKVSLVADEVENIEDKIEFKSENNIIENKVSLVADEVENIEDKIEFKSENNIIENKVNLVADEVENIEDKIEFKSENTIVENKVNLVADEVEVEAEVPFKKSHNNLNEYETIINRKSLSESIALNDKFIFVRELFGSQFTEYENNIRKIDELGNYQDALEYCKNSLSTKYNWENRINIANRFYELLEKNYAK